jgi:release factor glutamine methyltransferase
VTPPETTSALRAAGCVFAEDEAALIHAEAATVDDVRRMVEERVGGRPLEQVLGWAEFDGLRIVVAPGVFVPRRRSRLLVDLAAERAAGQEHPVVVDLCCGTGALAAAVLARVPVAEVYAADLDPAAVACARRNLPGHRVFEGDLFGALPDDLRGRIDVLLVNAPYVPSAAIATMPPEARDHEHRMALDGGADGLDVQRRVIEHAAAWLAPGGDLVIETGRHQVPATSAAMTEAGLVAELHTVADLDAVAVRGRQFGDPPPGPHPAADKMQLQHSWGDKLGRQWAGTGVVDDARALGSPRGSWPPRS